MKKVLVFIHKSLGELDWIAPFIKSVEAEEFSFFIYLNKVSHSHEDEKLIIEKYGLNKSNITLLDSSLYSAPVYKYIDRRLQKLKKRKVYWFRGLASYLRRKKAELLPYSHDFDFIFREYKLQYAFELACFLKVNERAKVVVFPHAVTILRSNTQLIAKAAAVKIDLWLENSPRGYQIPRVRDLCFISGAPGLSSHYKLEGMFSPSSPNVLINTRDTYEMSGCTKEAALERLESILDFCQRSSLTAYLKHHPRERELHLYHDIQKKYSCAKMFNGTLTSLKMKFRACLSFFSTSGLYLTARQIPVIDITPYVDFDESRPLDNHYSNKDGMLTHIFMEIGVQERLGNPDVLLSESRLVTLSKSQFRALKKEFPEGSNQKIADKMKKLVN